MNKRNVLGKRGLSLFMAVVMCLSMVNFTVFATDEHVHNENGWTCVYTEPVTEAGCTHEHNDECGYAPAVAEVPCAHQHDEACGYVGAKDEVPCDCGAQPDEEGNLTHEEGCAYAPAVEGTPCTHTHDEACGYAPAKAEVPCTHECGADCVKVVTEGTWTCTAPVEEQPEENDEEAAEAPSAEDAVQAFLNAVAALPAAEDVTPENAEAIGEQVNAALDLYEAIEDETDEVAAALETVYAVFEAVLAAEDIDGRTFERTSNVTKSPYEDFAPNKPGGEELIVPSDGFVATKWGAVNLTAGESTATDYVQVRYYAGHGGAYATGYSFWYPNPISTNPSVATATQSVGTLNGRPCIVVNFKGGTKKGTTTITVSYLCDNLCDEHGISVGDYYHVVQGDIKYTVTNNGGGDVTIKPADKPNANNIYVRMACDSYLSGYNHYGKAGYLSKHTDKWSLGEIVPCDWKDGYDWFCPLNMDMDKWTSFYNSNYGTHMFSLFGHSTSTTPRDAYNQKIPANELGFYWDGSDWLFYTGYLYIFMTEASSQIDYTVVHEYYTNGEFDGSVSETLKNAVTGTKIYPDKLIQKTVYEGNTYQYKSGTPDPLVCSDDVTANVITLRYERNVDDSDTTYTVIYTDGKGGESFGDVSKSGLKEGDATPTWAELSGKEKGAVPTLEGFTFMGWAPAVNSVVSDADADKNGVITYTATWQKNSDSEETTYRVVRDYYVDGEKIARTASGNTEGTVGQEIVGATLAAENPGWVYYTVDGKTLEFTYEGSYKGEFLTDAMTTGSKAFKVGEKAASITLTNNVKTNVIVLRYERNTPQKPTSDNVGDLVGQVYVYCQPERHEVGKFNVTADGRITIGDVEENNDAYTCTVTFNAQKYCDAYNTLKKTTTEETRHTLVSGEGNKTVVLTWNAESGTWELPSDFQSPVTFYVECPSSGDKTASYTVQWIDAEDGKVLKSETRSDTVGEPVSVQDTDKSYTDYTYAGDKHEGTILSATLAESGTVLKLYFTKDDVSVTPDKNGLKLVKKVNGEDSQNLTVDNRGENLNYTITVTNETNVDLTGFYIKDTMPTGLSAPTFVSVSVTDKGGEAVEVTAVKHGKAGNDHYWMLGNTVIPDGATVVLTYTATVNEDVTSKQELVNIAVSYASQNTPVAAMLAAARAAVLEEVGEFNPDDLSNPGFTSNEDSATVTAPEQGGGNEDPKTVGYTVEWYVVGETKPFKTDATRTGEVGKEVSATDADKDVEGYTFAADDENNVLSAEVKEDSSTVLKLYFTKNAEDPKTAGYKVEWYEVGKAEPFQTDDTRKGEVGKEVSVTDDDKAVEGYTFVADDENNVLAAEVQEDGSTVLKLYFTKDAENPEEPKDVSYTVVHEYYTNGTRNDSLTVRDTVNGKVGDVVAASDIEKKLTAGGSTYTYTSAAPATLTLAETGDMTIVLRYDRTTGGIIDPGPDPVTRYNLTIHYVYEDGTTAAPTHSSRHDSGYQYSVSSPSIEGYTPDQAVVSGTLTSDVTVTVVYTAEGANIPDEEPPLAELPDENPPLAELPDEEPPLAENPEVDIPDEQPPLAENPEVDIPDEDVPLDSTPKTGDDSHTGLWAGLCAVSLLGAVVFGRKEENEQA